MLFSRICTSWPNWIGKLTITSMYKRNVWIVIRLSIKTWDFILAWLLTSKFYSSNRTSKFYLNNLKVQYKLVVLTFNEICNFEMYSFVTFYTNNNRIRHTFVSTLFDINFKNIWKQLHNKVIVLNAKVCLF